MYIQSRLYYICTLNNVWLKCEKDIFSIYDNYLFADNIMNKRT